MAVEFAKNVFTEARSKVGSIVLEKLVFPAKLEIREGATIASAQEYDSHRGNYAESANHYYSVLEISSDPVERSNALIGLSQQLINLGKLGQAREVLNNSDEYLSDTLNEKQLFYYLASVKEKFGWIADYE